MPPFHSPRPPSRLSDRVLGHNTALPRLGPGRGQILRLFVSSLVCLSRRAVPRGSNTKRQEDVKTIKQNKRNDAQAPTGNRSRSGGFGRGPQKKPSVSPALAEKQKRLTVQISEQSRKQRRSGSVWRRSRHRDRTPSVCALCLSVGYLCLCVIFH